MGYKDAQGRDEWIAQPYISKGHAAARIVDTSEVVDDQIVDWGNITDEPHTLVDQPGAGERVAHDSAPDDDPAPA